MGLEEAEGVLLMGRAFDKRKTASTRAAVVAEIGDTTFYLGWFSSSF